MAPRVILVTGVGRRVGIGAEICRGFARAGEAICFTYWSAYDRAAPWAGKESAFPDEFPDELRRLGAADVAGVEVDLGNERSIGDLMETVIRLGRPSVLVNNAAVSESGGLEELDGPMLDRHYAVNVRGTVLLTKAVVDAIDTDRPGRVVNLTTGQALGPMPGELAYAMTKAAIESFTRSAAPQLASRGVTINAVDPGPTDTGWMDDQSRAAILARMPMGRVGQPSDAAALVRFLASDEAGWITGQVIHSDGGFWRR